ncbi:MAG: hypothetical protein P8163_02505 [Candidatus Thiodiazotropha sp.]
MTRFSKTPTDSWIRPAPEIDKYLNFDKLDASVESAQPGQEIAIKQIA